MGHKPVRFLHKILNERPPFGFNSDIYDFVFETQLVESITIHGDCLHTSVGDVYEGDSTAAPEMDKEQLQKYREFEQDKREKARELRRQQKQAEMSAWQREYALENELKTKAQLAKAQAQEQRQQREWDAMPGNVKHYVTVAVQAIIDSTKSTVWIEKVLFVPGKSAAFVYLRRPGSADVACVTFNCIVRSDASWDQQHGYLAAEVENIRPLLTAMLEMYT
jgi:hypothetical protein